MAYRLEGTNITGNSRGEVVAKATKKGLEKTGGFLLGVGKRIGKSLIASGSNISLAPSYGGGQPTQTKKKKDEYNPLRDFGFIR